MLAGKVDGRGTMLGGIPKFFLAGRAMTMIEGEKALLHRSAVTIGACRLAPAACGDAVAVKFRWPDSVTGLHFFKREVGIQRVLSRWARAFRQVRRSACFSDRRVRQVGRLGQ